MIELPKRMRVVRRMDEEVARARHDPNTFVPFCFRSSDGAELVQSAIHRDLQRFLSQHRFALVQLPRDHGKSTQVISRLVWELGRSPSLRIKIVCATEALAAERGRYLRTALEEPRVGLVFPHLKPSKEWSATRLTVQRPGNVIGPSVASIGVGAGSTGSRADLLVCDDIVDVRAVASKAERERVKRYFRENLLNLLEPDGRFWGLSTPWHREDLNAELAKEPGVALFRRAIGPNFEPVWPERWSAEALRERHAQIGPIAFNRGYRLTPLAPDEAMFRPEWVHFWTEPDRPTQVLLAVDPAASVAATADRSALVVLSMQRRRVRCLDAIARRAAAPELINFVVAMDQQWSPGTILVEANGPFQALAEFMKRDQRIAGRVLTVQQSRSKEERAEQFAAWAHTGAFSLQGDGRGNVDPRQRELLDEMLQFPSGEHDDLFDAAMFGTEHLMNQREPNVVF